MKIYKISDINLTKYLFFTGKGGVGKTSLACATAVGLADIGKNILLISTDPASNLQDVFNQTLNGHGSDKGLFSRDNDEEDVFNRLIVYHPHTRYLRKHGGNMIGIWCNVDIFCKYRRPAWPIYRNDYNGIE